MYFCRKGRRSYFLSYGPSDYLMDSLAYSSSGAFKENEDTQFFLYGFVSFTSFFSRRILSS
jgi:hypothetical protein